MNEIANTAATGSQAIVPLGRIDATGNLLGRWDHRVNGDSDFSLQIYYDYLKVDYHQNTFDLDFHHRLKLCLSNELILGFGYRLVHSDIVGTPQFSGTPAIRNDNLYSAFISHEEYERFLREGLLPLRRLA